MSRERELISILSAFGGEGFNPRTSISDWKHSEDRENKAKLKREARLLRNIRKQERSA